MIDETKLIAEIEAMINHNDIVKTNAMKVICVAEDPSRAREMWDNAKRDNQTLQSVIDLINEITLPKEK